IHPPAWEHAAERFRVDGKARWLSLQPRSLEAQGTWLLECLADGQDPAKRRDRTKSCKNYAKALARVRARGWVQKGKVALTAAGRKHIDVLRENHPGGLPKPRRCRTR